MNKKKSVINFFLVFIIFLFLMEGVFSLGVSPSSKQFNFQPGFEKIINYRVLGIDSDKELSLYVSGDLSKYVKLDRDSMKGPGEFSAIIELPDHIENPGPNKIFVAIREEVDKEISTMIAVSVVVKSIIVIHVPYPGKYLETKLISSNANIGEPIKFDLEVISRGDEDLIINPKIDIFSDQKLLETLVFQERDLASQEKIKLKKFLDTSNYNAGEYKAVATVNYGGAKPSIREADFKIGDLSIDILNYSKKIIIDKISRFNLELESGWNDPIQGLYADVSILRGLNELVGFETTTTQLTPWQKKTIVGYFDATNITEGFYDANITLTYYGKDKSRTSNELVKIEFIKKPFNMMIVVYILVGLIVLVIVLILLRKYIFKKKK